MSRRKSYNVAQRKAIWDAAKDALGNVYCWRCGGKIDVMKEGWHVGHVGVAHALGGSKVAPEHATCNMQDCYENVIPVVAKSNRVWSKANEKKVSRMPGSRNSNMKKCLNGKVIDRRTGKEWGT